MSVTPPHCAIGYKPEAGHIRDEYRVWVSPSRLCVEPFLQTGVHNYHLPIAYNVCTTGYRVRCSIGCCHSNDYHCVIISFRLVTWWTSGSTITTL